MTTELPEQPLSRTESYLAKAAGQDVVIPEKPESRLEQYLAAIAKSGDFFTADAESEGSGTTLELDNIIKLKDLKLQGGTKQERYSGKNLFNKNNVSNGYINDNGVLEPNDVWQFSDYIQVTPNISYTVSCARKEGSTGSMQLKFASYSNNTEGSFVNTYSQNRVPTLSYTVPSTANYIRVGYRKDQQDNIQLEQGAATEYEPYVGGIPSPNPEYPQNVNVVAGEQTVTVSGDGQSQNYTINLGQTELCKIDNYQDYVYKSGEDWYVHKETGKVIFDGTEADWGNDTSGGYLRVFHSLNNVLYASGRVADGYSNYFTANTTNAHGVYLRNQGNVYFYPQSSITTLADFKTWLSTHNTNLYYPLATATDTKITNADLITQLNALANASGYNGKTVLTVAATGTNLPATLEVTAYTKSLNGLIEMIEA